MPIKLVFFATPNIAKESFVSLVSDNNFEVSAFVTQSPKPAGRGKKIVENELKKYALENNIEVIETEKISRDTDTIQKLKSYNADFFITFAFGQILSQEIIDIPKFGIINLHASLLPKYRGANPIRQALIDGCDKTGITTMLTSLGMDEGDICLTKEISLNSETNSIELTDEISKISPNIIKETILGLYSGKIKPQKQDSSCATYTKKTTKEDKIICWNNSNKNIHNKVRALIDNFTCQTTYCGKIIKILKTELNEKCEGMCGEITDISKSGILVRCKVGSILIKKIKPEGKGEMDAYSWSLGARVKKGDKFE